MKDNEKMTPRMLLGKIGENAACSFLESKGHIILERNCRKGHLEIDIISMDGDGVHFVEVKSRMAPVAVDPQENVTPSKQKKITQAALKYLNSSKDPRITCEMEVSFDVIAVTFEGGKTNLEWFPRAWYPIYC